MYMREGGLRASPQDAETQTDFGSVWNDSARAGSGGGDSAATNF